MILMRSVVLALLDIIVMLVPLYVKHVLLAVTLQDPLRYAYRVLQAAILLVLRHLAASHAQTTPLVLIMVAQHAISATITLSLRMIILSVCVLLGTMVPVSLAQGALLAHMPRVLVL